MPNRTATTAALALTILVSAPLAGCSSTPKKPAADAPIVPAAWVEKVSKQWPASEGKQTGMATLSVDGRCEVLASDATANGVRIEVQGAGYGPVGRDGGFAHLCGLYVPDKLTGDLRLVVLPSSQAVDAFADRARNPSNHGGNQDHEVTEQTSGRYHVIVDRYTYPTNPAAGGNSLATVVDPESKAALELDVVNLKDDAFDAYTAQKAADDMAALLDAGGA